MDDKCSTLSRQHSRGGHKPKLIALPVDGGPLHQREYRVFFFLDLFYEKLVNDSFTLTWIPHKVCLQVSLRGSDS